MGDIIYITDVFKAYERRKVVIYMNRTLATLKGLTAEQLLHKYNISLEPPVDINLLLNRIGIQKVAYDFNKIEDILQLQKDEITGILYTTDENIGIFYKYNDPYNRVRFTLAHELAHCCLHADTIEQRHIETRTKNNAKEPREIQANIFAGEILIPKYTLDLVYNKFISTPPISVLARIFEVSISVMKARLDYLELPYGE